MGRTRKPIKPVVEGRSLVARFVHPVLKRTVRCNLGHGNEADHNLNALNRIFLDQSLWHNPPDNTPLPVLKSWLGEAAGVVLQDGSVEADGQPVQVDADEMARVLADNQRLERENTVLRSETRRLRRQLEDALGRKVRTGKCPTIGEATESFLPTIAHRSLAHTMDAVDAMRAFRKAFDEKMEVDEFDGQEEKIDRWLTSLRASKGPRKGQPITTERRKKLRKFVVRCLEHAGLRLDRKRFQPISIKDIRRERGPIRWLSRQQAERLAEALPSYWSDLFRTQASLGLRPGEVITLKKADFADDLGTVTLSPLLHLTLKTGSRTVRIDRRIRPLIRRRLDENPILFAGRNGEPWRSAKVFNEYYRQELVKAARTAGIETKMDTRIARRTCASLLIRAGANAEGVAAILGNSPEMIREHYGRLLPQEVDPGAAVIAGRGKSGRAAS